MRKRNRRLIGNLILLSGFLTPCAVQGAEEGRKNIAQMQAVDIEQMQTNSVRQSTAAGGGETADPGDGTADPAAGQILAEEDVSGREGEHFTSGKIPEGGEVYNRIYGKSYYPNEDIGIEDLRYLKVLHYNFSHQIQVGELIVNAAVSEDVLNVFLELFQEEYEIESMRLIDDFWVTDGTASDTNSMEHNNTSAFCYRQITSGGGLSNHALGFAIDINPLQNPYVRYTDGQANWTPENASAYLDRTSGDAHVIVQDDVCCNIFTKYGFSWGGLWENPVDYQHFEKVSESF